MRRQPERDELRVRAVLTRYLLCNDHLVVTSPDRIIGTRRAFLIRSVETRKPQKQMPAAGAEKFAAPSESRAVGCGLVVGSVSISCGRFCRKIK
jgi:hypothetical protein